MHDARDDAEARPRPAGRRTRGVPVQDQPRHPGGAHYLIHAYDSPITAPNGLAAARGLRGRRH
jgi:hypothetical protein